MGRRRRQNCLIKQILRGYSTPRPEATVVEQGLRINPARIYERADNLVMRATRSCQKRFGIDGSVMIGRYSPWFD